MVEGVFDQASLTCQDATTDPRDALYLCDVVVGEVFVTSGIESLRITEGPPQVGGDGFIVYLDELCADVVSFGEERSVSQDADAVEKVGTSSSHSSDHLRETLRGERASHLREDGGVDGGLDDSGVNGHDGEDDTGQEDQRQLVHISDPDKHHQHHEAQHDGAVHPHVVEESQLCLLALQALDLKDGCLGDDINLKEWKDGGRKGK